MDSLSHILWRLVKQIKDRNTTSLLYFPHLQNHPGDCEVQRFTWQGVSQLVQDRETLTKREKTVVSGDQLALHHFDIHTASLVLWLALSSSNQTEQICSLVSLCMMCTKVPPTHSSCEPDKPTPSSSICLWLSQPHSTLLYCFLSAMHLDLMFLDDKDMMNVWGINWS